tara:strand:+ start:896 stop:1753 length:858 start_codon:yes stop_codon:yes gene_type:complete
MKGFYLLGDMGSGNNDQKKVANSLTEHIHRMNDKRTFICGLGDNIYEAGCTSINDRQFIKKFEEPYIDIDNNIKFYMCLGNHDYGDDFFDKKGNSLNQIEYGKLSQKKGGKWYMPSNYYMFNKGNISFFVLDTNLKNQTKQEIEEQLNYFIDKIKTSNNKWKILIGHHTMRSVGGHGNADKDMEEFFHKLLKECSFDIYICGHDHNKQVINTSINNKDITLMVCGTGGKYYHNETNLENLKEGELEFCSTNLGYSYCVPKKNSLIFYFFDELNNLEYKYPLKKKI